MLVVILMAFAMMPTSVKTVYAEENSSKSIALGASSIVSGDRIWFGGRPEEAAEQQDAEWRVLEVDGARAMLISEKVLKVTAFSTEKYNNKWYSDTCIVRDLCQKMYDNWPSAIEQASIMETSKHDGVFQTGEQEIFGELDIKDEHLFLLSAEEAATLFQNDAERKTVNLSGWECYWWLRSGRPDRGDLAAFVWKDGNINNWIVNQDNYYGSPPIGFRPAFNLNSSEVLLTSAIGSKAGDLGEFSEISSTTSNEKKLTFHDANRDQEDGFKVSLGENAELTVNEDYDSWAVPVTYSGAFPGENEYVSAILCGSSGEALYYGSFAKSDVSGSLDIPIPSGLAVGKYTLNVFNEQKNNNYTSDYSSAFTTFNLEVKYSSPVIDPSTRRLTLPEGLDVMCLGDEAEVSVKITDNGEITQARMIYKGPDNWYRIVPLSHAGNDTWAGKFDVLDTTPPGNWQIRYIDARDNDGAVSEVFNSNMVDYEPTLADLSAGDFIISKWCNITFNTDGGSDVLSQKVLMGGKASEPEAPTKPGFSFVGWYEDETLKKPFDFGSTIDDDTIVYARWVSADDMHFLGNYTVTFDDKYHVLDDNESTPYEDWFYFVPSGTVLEPIATIGDFTLSPKRFKASYSECRFNEDRNEWEIIDDSAWMDHFPTDVGVYCCKVEGVGSYFGTFEWIDSIRIIPGEVVPEVTLNPSSVTYNGKSHLPKLTVKVDGKEVAYKSNIQAKGYTKAGNYRIEVNLTGNYTGSAMVTFTIKKAANPMAVKGMKVKVKAKDLKKKSQTIAATKLMKFTRKINDKKAYTLSSAMKGKKDFTKYFRINKTTGKLAVRKGLKKGSYKVKVKVRALGNTNYKPSVTKVAAFKIVVK